MGVLPSKAFAKLSTRLVPDQNHREITRLLAAHLQKVAPPAVTVTVRDLHGGEPASVRQDSVAMRAAARAYADAFGTAPVFMREGGSIPVVSSFQRHLGIETILMGFGLPDDRLHSPNEKLDLLMFRRGMETSARFMAYLRGAAGCLVVADGTRAETLAAARDFELEEKPPVATSWQSLNHLKSKCA